MRPDDPNLAAVLQVARALGALRERVLFVGGAAVGLLLTDPAAPTPRPTVDVDLVVDIESLGAWHSELGAKLNERGFRQLASAAADEPLCAWRLHGLRVDIVPTNERVLGFTNPWYASAREHPLQINVEDVSLLAIDGPHFLATKLEAFLSRGRDDVYASHDLEDAVAVIDGRPELGEEIGRAPALVATFLRAQFGNLLARRDFLNALGGHVQDEGRDQVVLRRIRQITG